MSAARDKIERYLEDIVKAEVEEREELKNWYYLPEHSDILHPEELPEEGWRSISPGESWGGEGDQHGWFCRELELSGNRSVEDSWLYLDLGRGHRSGLFGAEGLFFVDHYPWQGIDDRHRLVSLAGLPDGEDRVGGDEEKRTVLLHLRADSGRDEDVRTLRRAELQRRHQGVRRLHIMARNILSALDVLPEDDLHHSRLLSVLEGAIDMVDMRRIGSEKFYSSAAGAADWLEEKIEQKPDEVRGDNHDKPAVTAVGHAHIDVAWLWELERTRAKCARSWSTALRLLDENEDFHFLQSSPQLYQFVAEDYPRLFQDIREAAREESWEPAGGMWVEADTNISGGEALVRQFLYGQRYLRENFGSSSRLLWLPDVFGFSAALPQLARQAGIEYFVTSKLSWNQFNRFPCDLFRWRGIDGSEILSYLLTTPDGEAGEEWDWRSTYNADLTAESVSESWRSFRQQREAEEVLVSCGWGDGGGGPSRRMLENAGVIDTLPGLPSLQFGSALDFFERLEDSLADAPDEKELPVWDGELYLEYHRGTYTSQAWTKMYNRRAEEMLRDVEMLYSRLALSDEISYPRRQLEESWQTLLKNQFHDILPGSSIAEVYKQAEAEYEEILARGELLLCRGLAAAAGCSCRFQEQLEPGARLLVYNPTSWSRDEIIYPGLAEFWQDYVLEDEEGNVKRVYTGGDFERARIMVEDISPGEIREYTVRPAADYELYAAGSGSKSAGGGEESGEGSYNFMIDEERGVFATDRLRLELDETGRIVSFYDRECERELVEEGDYFNKLIVYEDRPLNYDAWDIDIYYQDKPYQVDDLQGREILRETPERLLVRQRWEFLDSTIEQDMILKAGRAEVDFRTRVDWQESQLLLRAHFPTSLRSRKASYGIQFGSLERPAHSNTSLARARFEVPAQRWADISQVDYGLSLLADWKYGFSAIDGELGITLLKSAVEPDPAADRRHHYFTYSLYPHEGSPHEARTHEKAHSLSRPLHWTLAGHGGLDDAEIGPGGESFLDGLESESTDIAAIKLSEEGGDLILRCYEYAGRRDRAALTFPDWLEDKIGSVREVNLLEESPAEGELEKNKWSRSEVGLQFEMQPFQIRTWRLEIED